MGRKALKTKKCGICGKVKDTSLFSPSKTDSSGRYGYCKPCNAARSSKWHNENKERAKIRNRRWVRDNPTKVKEYNQKQVLKVKTICMNYYGLNGGCVCCFEKELSFLSLDHIKDDGAKDRRKDKRSGYLLYRKLIKMNFPPGFQTLCHNCQWGKRINNGFCPHHPKKDLRKTCKPH